MNQKIVGAVEKLEIGPDNKPIATILTDTLIDIPKGSEFILTYAFLSRPEIVIEPTTDDESIDMESIQNGKVKKLELDTLSSESEKLKYDSLMKYDEAFRKKDSIIRTLLPMTK